MVSFMIPPPATGPTRWVGGHWRPVVRLHGGVDVERPPVDVGGLGAVGARDRYGDHFRSRMASITSRGAMWARYRSVVAREAWPSWRWMMGIGIPSIISS